MPRCVCGIEFTHNESIRDHTCAEHRQPTLRDSYDQVVRENAELHARIKELKAREARVREAMTDIEAEVNGCSYNAPIRGPEAGLEHEERGWLGALAYLRDALDPNREDGA